MRLNKDRVGKLVGASFGKEMLEASDRAQAGNPESEQVWLLLTEEVQPDPEQPRRHFDEAALTALAEDISRRGVLEPLLVRRVGGGYRIIVGERRWRASKLAGKVRVPCLVRDWSEDEVREAQLVENVLRQDLNDIERGLALRQLYESLKATDGSVTWEKVALRVGLTRMRIHHLYSLSLLPEEIVGLIQSRRLSGSHGIELSRLSERPEEMVGLAREASRAPGSKGGYSLSVAQVRERIGGLLNQATPSPLRRVAPERLERHASELLASLRPDLPADTRNALRQKVQAILQALDEPPPIKKTEKNGIVKSSLQSPQKTTKGAPK